MEYVASATIYDVTSGERKSVCDDRRQYDSLRENTGEGKADQPLRKNGQATGNPMPWPFIISNNAAMQPHRQKIISSCKPTHTHRHDW